MPKNRDQEGGSSTSLRVAPTLINDPNVYGEKSVIVGQVLPSLITEIMVYFSLLRESPKTYIPGV